MSHVEYILILENETKKYGEKILQIGGGVWEHIFWVDNCSNYMLDGEFVFAKENLNSFCAV